MAPPTPACKYICRNVNIFLINGLHYCVVHQLLRTTSSWSYVGWGLSWLDHTHCLLCLPPTWTPPLLPSPGNVTHLWLFRSALLDIPFKVVFPFQAWSSPMSSPILMCFMLYVAVCLHQSPTCPAQLTLWQSVFTSLLPAPPSSLCGGLSSPVSYLPRPAHSVAVCLH